MDYGCGPGSYVLPLCDLVGDSGKIYALDIHPLAIRKVESLVSRKGLHNVAAIRSSCDTGLSDESVDVVLLYDIFHDLSEPARILTELHRVLKPEGILSVSDHHLDDKEIMRKIPEGGRFRLDRRGKRTFTFTKIKPVT